MSTTDLCVKAAGAEIVALKPLLDSPRKPSCVRVAIYLNPDGTIREIESEPVFKTRASRA